MKEEPRRRHDVRFLCHLEAFTSSPNHPIRPAIVLNVSERGIGLSMDEIYGPGDPIYLQLMDDPEVFVEATVARVNRKCGEGWQLGCIFASAGEKVPTRAEMKGHEA